MRDNEVMVKKTCDLADVSEADIFRNTGLGVVEERGTAIRDTAVGDRVVWAGVAAEEMVIVPEYLFAGVPDGVDDNAAMYAGAGGYVLQSFRASRLTFGEKVGVSGKGLLSSLVSRVVPLFGMRLLDTGSSTGEAEIDGLFVCPGEEPTASTLERILRPKSTVVVMAQGEAGLQPAVLQEKKVKLVYPGAPRPETRDVCYPGAYMRWRIKDDMELFLRLLRDGKISMVGICG